MGPETISNWTVTDLAKYVKDFIEHQPPLQLTSLDVDDLTVVKTLTVSSQVSFAGRNFLAVGGTGAPAFTNAWVNAGSPYAAAQYMKDALGWIRFHGAIKSGTVGSAAWTMPPGFRPDATIQMPVVTNTTGAIGIVQVGSDGTVTPVTPSSNVIVHLDGITYQAA